MTTPAAIITVTRGNGRAVHAAYANAEGQPWGTYCAADTLMGGRSDLRLRRVAGEVTCKLCLKSMAPAPAAEVAPSPNHPTVDLPAHLEGPRLPTTYRPEGPRVGRPPVGPLRSVRVSAEVWDAATETAAARGETVSEVIRRALEHYAAAFPADIRPGVTP